MTPILPFELTGIMLEPGRQRSERLYAALRERIVSTPDSSGCKLPASRSLAAALGVSRNTVVNVYERLYAEGFVETRVGDGTYVASLHQPLAVRPPAPALDVGQKHIDMRQPIMQQFNRHLVHEGSPRPFRIGTPAVDQFPFDVWSRLQARFWRSRPIHQMGYGHPAGDPRLRELIAHYLRHARGLECEPSQILITLGAQQAIMLCATLLLRKGDEVAIENPYYWAAAGAFASLGVKITGIDVDEEGMVTSQLAGMAGADVRLAYVSPSCQYPTGATLSLPRRLELLQWAQQRNAWIIEDDYDGEYRYSGTPLTPLAALNHGERVIYIGSFSKVMYPGLRLGYLVAPPPLMEQLVLLRTLSDRQQQLNDQVTMASFIAEGHFQQHIRRMRKVSRSRRDALMDAWQQYLGHIGHMPQVSSGLHVTIGLASREEETALIDSARRAGIEITALSTLWLPGSDAGSDCYGLILGFAGIPEQQIVDAVRTLRSVWD